MGSSEVAPLEVISSSRPPRSTCTRNTTFPSPSLSVSPAYGVISSKTKRPWCADRCRGQSPSTPHRASCAWGHHSSSPPTTGWAGGDGDEWGYSLCTFSISRTDTISRMCGAFYASFSGFRGVNYVTSIKSLSPQFTKWHVEITHQPCHYMSKWRIGIYIIEIREYSFPHKSFNVVLRQPSPILPTSPSPSLIWAQAQHDINPSRFRTSIEPVLVYVCHWYDDSNP